MADKRNSDNSLERELDYEDLTIQAGESSKLRRQQNKKRKEEEEAKKEAAKKEAVKKEAAKKEEQKQVETKEAMFQAGESSRIRRRRRGGA